MVFRQRSSSGREITEEAFAAGLQHTDSLCSLKAASSACTALRGQRILAFKLLRHFKEGHVDSLRYLGLDLRCLDGTADSRKRCDTGTCARYALGRCVGRQYDSIPRRRLESRQPLALCGVMLHRSLGCAARRRLSAQKSPSLLQNISSPLNTPNKPFEPALNTERLLKMSFGKLYGFPENARSIGKSSPLQRGPCTPIAPRGVTYTQLEASAH